MAVESHLCDRGSSRGTDAATHDGDVDPTVAHILVPGIVAVWSIAGCERPPTSLCQKRLLLRRRGSPNCWQSLVDRKHGASTMTFDFLTGLVESIVIVAHACVVMRLHRWHKHAPACLALVPSIDAVVPHALAVAQVVSVFLDEGQTPHR
jgi:hypothetical protein